MAKVYSAPEEIAVPTFNYNDYSSGKYGKDFEKFKSDLADYCKKNSKCADAGKIIQFQIADGYAQYMVFDYRTLIHIPEGDGYQIPDAHARGLRKDDIVKLIKSREALDSLFARKQA